MNPKQKVLTVIAVVAFLLIGFGIVSGKEMHVGFLLWFMLAVVYTALFFVLKDSKK
jgi:uncharacterized membrane protein YhdT